MTNPPEHSDSEFSLFDEEEGVLRRADSMIAKLEEVSAGLGALAEAYRQGYSEQRRMVRISDRLQLDLHKANQALEAENKVREGLEAELRLIATVDVLTGLYTRRHILELGGQEERRWHRHGGHLSLALIDIDHFKKVNDTHGHAAGDEVLKKFAEVCRKTFRQIDFIGRFGGEEFMVILPDTGMDDACAITERLRLNTENENIQLQNAEVKITVSIGVSEMNQSDASLEQAISRADAALYRAKNNGRNRIERAHVEEKNK